MDNRSSVKQAVSVILNNEVTFQQILDELHRRIQEGADGQDKVLEFYGEAINEKSN